MTKAQAATASGNSDNELLGEFKDLLAATAREVSQAATVPALEAVFHQWNERLTTLTQGAEALHEQTLSDYRAWEDERQTALDVFREKLQQSQAALTEASTCCRDTQSFLQGIHQQGEAALKTHSQLVEEFLRLTGERAFQMAQAVDNAANCFTKQTGQWESLLLEGDSKVTKLTQAAQQWAEQSATQSQIWQDLLQRSQQTLGQYSEAVQAADKRLARESSAWRAAVTETGEKISRLTEVVEATNASFREGITTLEEQIRLQVREQETTGENLNNASETMKRAGEEFHHLMSGVVKKFNEICTKTSAGFDRSVQQASATLGAVLAAVQEGNTRLRVIEESLGKRERDLANPLPAAVIPDGQRPASSTS